MKMMSHLLRRRFVNIVSENCESATCSLHRLNVSEHLFYPSTAEADQGAAKPPAAAISTLESLPEPTFSFQPEPRLFRMEQLFTLVNPRSSESRILWRSPEGVTLLYDADSNCSHAMPSLAYKGWMPVAISIPRRPNADADAETPDGEDLYVMNSSKSYSSFQVLTFGGGRTYKSPWRRSHRDKPWQWDSLPPPPLPQGFVIRSHTVLNDGVTICVTAIYFGPVEKPLLTYLLDTARREWRQPTGGRHWDLPFEGGAEYVPDLKLWLGFCRDDKHELCAYDLSAATAGGEPPTLKRLGELIEMPKEWESVEPRLINLGNDRFCLARIMQEVWYGEDEEEEEEEDDDDDDDEDCSDLFVSKRGGMLAVLTGVEMVRGEEGFRMVAHKSLSYMCYKTCHQRLGPFPLRLS